jgi:hypothetical protein
LLDTSRTKSSLSRGEEVGQIETCCFEDTQLSPPAPLSPLLPAGGNMACTHPSLPAHQPGCSALKVPPITHHVLFILYQVTAQWIQHSRFLSGKTCFPRWRQVLVDRNTFHRGMINNKYQSLLWEAFIKCLSRESALPDMTLSYTWTSCSCQSRSKLLGVGLLFPTWLGSTK